MKNTLKKLVVAILVSQVKRLRKKHTFKVVAIAGSIGKTSTKAAVASVLSVKYKVRYQEANYNDAVTVPLLFFGLRLPSLFSPFAWLITFLRIEWQLRRPYPYEIVVVELGTDGPGQLAGDFKSFLHADIGIATAVTPEHMEFFGSIEEVAKEELVISELSDSLLLNTDLCDPKFMPQRQHMVTYGMETDGVYKIVNTSLTAEGYTFDIQKLGAPWLSVAHPSIAVPQLYSLTAAAVVADLLGLSLEEIKQGIVNVKAVSGRMQILQGIKGATIIDESYNASPDAVKAALKTIYALPGVQKIALLGNMNELGKTYSPSAHAEIGALCDPQQLQHMVTLGPDANEYLASAAERRGCQVHRFDSPYAAGEFIKSVLEDDAVLLIKGSQNRVFAEEAIKTLLQNPEDTSKLVRQSKQWLAVKRKQFKDFPA
jgi:UDP-N-acetylmuramoyl-tripeptide--D-alanyl-D-alanine ligase